MPRALDTIAEAASHKVTTTYKIGEGYREEKEDEEEEDGVGDRDSEKIENCGTTGA